MRTAQIINIAILLLILASVCVVSSLVMESDNLVILGVYIVAVALFGFLVYPRIARALRDRVREHATPAEQVMAKDPRPPVVYLRSFSEDGTRPETPVFLLSPFPTYVNKPTYEEGITHYFRKIGPFVALTGGSHGPPELGASRLTTRDEDWRRTFEDLVQRCSLVIFRAGDSQSLMWELNRLVACIDPRKVIIYLQIGPEIDLGVQQARYNKFRRLTSSLFPRSLPEQRGKNTYLTFGKAWDPVLGKNLKTILKNKGY